MAERGGRKSGSRRTTSSRSSGTGRKATSRKATSRSAASRKTTSRAAASRKTTSRAAASRKTTSRSRAAAAAAAEARPNGPVAAILLATGIGALVLAVLTCWAEANESFKESLAYDDEVGPLSGKTIWGTAAFLISWGALTALWRRREVDMRAVLIGSGVLLALGLVGTFAPFFEMFAPEE